jgi:hypothetical protein
MKDLTGAQSAAAGTHNESALVFAHWDLEFPLRTHRAREEGRGEERRNVD